MANNWDRELFRRMGEAYGTKSRQMEDLHRQNPEIVRGGCGQQGCSICYNPDGSLKSESGKYVQMGGDLRNAPPRGPSDYMSLKAEYLQTLRPSRDDSKLREAREPVEKWIIKPSAATSWDSIIGNESAKEALREAIEASTTHKKLFEFYEMATPKGVLLWGPPGCGKTMLGKAAAAALGRIHGASATELMLLNGAELESPIVGIAASKVRSVFAYAREYEAYHGHPLVIFIDEADAMLKSRESAPWTAELVGQFLAEMDGLRASGAFIILATNRPDELDEALLREGRVDRKIKIERPGLEAAKLIARGAVPEGKAWLSEWDENFVEYLFDPSHLLREIVNPESGARHHFTLGHIVNGAMIVGLIARAKSRAFKRDKKHSTQTGVTLEDLREAIHEVLEENKGLNHDYALREFVVEVALPAEQARAELNNRNGRSMN